MTARPLIVAALACAACASVDVTADRLWSHMVAGELSGAAPSAVLDAASLAWDRWASAHGDDPSIEAWESERTALHDAALAAARGARGDPDDPGWLAARDRLIAWLAMRGAVR